MESLDTGLFDPQRRAFQLDWGTWLLDLGFQGRGGVVAAYLLAGEDGLALIETGPSSTLQNLDLAVQQAGFSLEQVTSALVTHIHLDHAGAAGVLARQNPALKVYVHPFGSTHIIDPTKLLISAGRIYGDQMDSLWGEVAPIPEAQVHLMTDGEQISLASRTLEVLFTPGHASHHVVYWDAESGTAFTGDVGGVRMQDTGYNCPPAPPPDLDPDAWHESIRKMQGLGARRWCLTHFGAFDDAGEHIDQLAPNLDAFVDLSMHALDTGADQTELTQLLHDRMALQLGPAAPGVLTNLEWATPSYMAALGMTRLHRKRNPAS